MTFRLMPDDLLVVFADDPGVRSFLTESNSYFHSVRTRSDHPFIVAIVTTLEKISGRSVAQSRNAARSPIRYFSRNKTV
jgi:hypothetical protein